MQARYAELEQVNKDICTYSRSYYGTRSLQYSRALIKLADLYRTQARYKEAEPINLQVIQTIEDTVGTNNLEYTNAAISLANLYKEMNRFGQAELYFLQAIDIYEVIVGRNHESYVRALTGYASVLRAVGRVQEAEPLYAKALGIYKNTLGTGSDGYADLLNDYGLYLEEMGHYEKALEYFQESLEITEKNQGKRSPNYASTLDNLGVILVATGHYEQAEPIYVESAKIKKDILGPKHPMYATSLNNVANLYEKAGRNSDAKKLYSEALEIVREIYGIENSYYANALDNMATVFENEQNYEQAEKFLKESVAINKRLFGEHHIYYTTALNNLARVRMFQNNTSDAELLFKNNIENTKLAFGDQHPDYATAIANLADLYEYTERYEEAEKYYRESLKIRKDKLGVEHPDYTTNLSRLAGLLSATGKYEEADLVWDEALLNYLKEIKLYFPSMSEKEKQQFYAKIGQEFEEYNSYAILRSQSNPMVLNKMYNNQLATKALLLNASSKVRQRILASKNEKLIKTYKLWQQQKEYLSKIYSLSKEELAIQKINVDSIVALANQYEKELSKSSEDFKHTSDTLTYTWKMVQKKLKDGEAAIEIIRFRKHDFKKSGVKSDTVIYAALIVTRDTKKHPELVVMSNGKEMESKYIAYYRNVVKFKVQDEYTYDIYWKGISHMLKGISKVYFSPDGVYNQINLNTIKNKESGKFVLDEIEVHMLTNTKDMVKKYAVRNSNKLFVGFANPDYLTDGQIPSAEEDKTKYKGIMAPLPGTKNEMNLISGMMAQSNWRTQVYMSAEANEKQVKQVNNPKVLHIATHGFFERDYTKNTKKAISAANPEKTTVVNPLLKSGLMMAGASVTVYNKKNPSISRVNTDDLFEDGVLTSYEVMNLSLDSTDLVILSACETGLGEVANGEGVYGLQRAFIIAGAESIILSLWKVDDKTTQELMTTFYNEWINRLQKSGKHQENIVRRQAFRAAQTQIKQKYPDPYFWGAFVIIGD
ncbi:MAG: CHAT domain-containing protein [Cytophagaceae bacterium]|nr:CHAT domain-containing protein [Cytophagaceae bacterium]